MVSAETVLAEFNIVPVIIFLVVVGKIVKTLKEAASKGAAPPKPPMAAKKQKLEQDLERFFERLATQNNPVEEAAPPPVPSPARTTPKAKAARQVQPSPPRREPKRAQPVAAAVEVKPQVVPLRPVPVWGGMNYGLQASVPKGAVCNYGSTEARREIVAMIKDDKSIRKAILLREILGPPVSLRH